MLKNCLPLMIGLAVVAPLSAGEAEKFFSERARDFGTVPFGPAQVHHFKITNTSNQVARIASARVSCGCTTATIPVNTLKPGESTFLTASMDTKRFIGQKEVIIYVTFSNPAEEVTLSVKANRNDSFSKSAEVVSMGQARKGGEAVGSVQVTMRNDPNFTITGATTNTDYVTVAPKELKRDRFEVVYELTATMKPGLDVGVWTTDMVFTTTSPSLSTVRIPVMVEIVAPITATPAQVQFPAVKVGDSKELIVVVKGDKPFKIVEVQGGDGLIKAVADGNQSKQAHVVRLVFQPSAAGETLKNIVVVTDNGTEGKVTIPVRTTAKMD